MIIYKFVLSLSIAVLNCFLLSEALILAFLKNNIEKLINALNMKLTVPLSINLML